MESSDTYWSDLAALDWQVDLGADEAIGEAPIDRYALEPQVAKVMPVGAAHTSPLVAKPVDVDPISVAQAAADGATDLPSLVATLSAFSLCDLRHGANNLVFSDGDPSSRVMVISDVPDRDEDASGKPFAGKSGALFDKMFAAIGLGRHAATVDDGVYIGACMPWRPPAGSDLSTAETAMLVPFLKRHIALVQPRILIGMGMGPSRMLLNRPGITRLRGKWQEIDGCPMMVMQSPAMLLDNPAEKREAWADLLAVRAKLESL